VIYFVLLILVVVVGLGYQKYRGNQALTFTHIDVSDLTLDEIVNIGCKASGSLAGRLVGSMPSARRTEDGAEWQAQIRGSVMSFSAAPLPNGIGYRIGGAATKMRVAQVHIGSDQGIWGLSKAMSNAIYRALGIPHSPGALVQRRKRVLRAIANAGTALEPSPAALPAAGGPPAGEL
jgi:hypothetical protein